MGDGTSRSAKRGRRADYPAKACAASNGTSRVKRGVQPNVSHAATGRATPTLAAGPWDPGVKQREQTHHRWIHVWRVPL
ncbi:hypothetical protein GCM10023107_39210 [Actinoplanes octamycinicus]|nr:hypothetical protein Aoc01nite_68420 [Actinoplanes octamycinicus]